MARRMHQDTEQPIFDHSGAFTSSDGVTLDLVYWRDREVDRKGRVTDRIDAHVDGQPVGYLKITLVPAEQWDRRCPTAYGYMTSRMNGDFMQITRQLEAHPDDSQWTTQQLQDAILDSHGWLQPAQERELRNIADIQRLQEMWHKRKIIIGQENQDRFEEARSSARDRPMVSYIQVYSQRDRQQYKDGVYHQLEAIGQEESGFSIYREHENRRKGYGTAMYEAGAIWMAERGMHLHASDVQSDPAIATWEKLATKHTVHESVYDAAYRDAKVPWRHLDGTEIARTLGIELRPQLSSVKKATRQVGPAANSAAARDH